MKLYALCAAAVLLVSGSIGYTATLLDPDLPVYQKASGVSGNFSSVGSDTLANLMTNWAEAYKRDYPNVNIQIQAAGSSTAPPALIEGTSNFGPMSRKMKDKEIGEFERKYGYKPTAIAVAIDALAVFAHQDNPIKGLSLAQIDAIFSSTRKCGEEKNITRWSQLGVSGPLARQNIQLFGRNSVSGTYGYFKEHALCKGDYKSSVNEQPGSASVVQSVATSLNGLGYSGIGYKTASVRALPISRKGTDYVAATPETAATGQYPLARFLYIYVNKAPGQELAPMEREFIKLVLSKQGQQIVIKDGFIPLPARLVDRELSTLGI